MFSLHRKPLWWAVAEKEIKEILRSPVLLLLSLFVPVVFFFILGFGINLDVENIPVAVVDYDNTFLSREFSDAIYNNKYFTLVGFMTESQAEKLLKINRLRAIIIIPQNFEKKLYENRASEIQILIDGTYPYRADVIRGYMASLTNTFTGRLISKTLNKRGIDIELSPVRLDVRSFYNQSMLSAYSLIPGLFVIILFINLATMTSLAVVREKDYGTIVNIYISRISRLSFIWGKVFPYFMVGIINLVTLFILSFVVFKLPFRGSVFSLFFISSVYILSTCFLGTLISSFSSTMMGAQFAAMVVTVIPSFLYSGYLMPTSSLGKGGQIEAALLPCKYYMNSIRGLFLKGFLFKDIIFDSVAIALFSCVMLIFSVALFKKREG